MNREKEQTNGERFEEFMRTVEGYPELEGTMNLCNDIIEKRTGKMTEEEWQAAERAQMSSQTEIYYTKQDVIDTVIRMYDVFMDDTLEAKKLRLKGISWHIQNILESLKKDKV